MHDGAIDYRAYLTRSDTTRNNRWQATQLILLLFSCTVPSFPSKYNIQSENVQNGLQLFISFIGSHFSPNSRRFETTRYGKHSVRYLGPFLWSKLTDNQGDTPSLPVFSGALARAAGARSGAP